MTTKAAKALKSLKTLSGDDIGSLRGVKASELGTEIRCQNHAERVALRKQVDVWYRDQNDSVRKLSRDQQHAFRKLIKIQNEKKRIKRKSYIQKQREIQQKLREQAIKDRENAARKFLVGTIKKGRKNIIQRQKDKVASNLDDIKEHEEEEEKETNPEANLNALDDDESRPQAVLPHTDGTRFLLETGKGDIFGNGNDEKGDTTEYGSDDKSREKVRDVALRMSSRNSNSSKQSGHGWESVDSGIVSSDGSQHSSRLASIKDAIHGENQTQNNAGNETPPLDKLMPKNERRVTFVDDEKIERFSKTSEYDTEDDEERESLLTIADDTNSQQKLSHHQVIVIDGDTGQVDVLPREKTRVVDETMFLRNKVGGMSLKSNKTPQINGAHFRPSTSERNERGGKGDELTAVIAKADSDLENIFAISRENAGTQNTSINADDNGTLSISRMNTTSILPPISEYPRFDEQDNATGSMNDENRGIRHVISDAVTSSASLDDRDDALSKTSTSGSCDGARQHTGSGIDPQQASGDIALDDDDHEAARHRAREERMRERRKLEDDMHKYHVGIANRTFKIPSYEVPHVPSVPVYTRNSEGSLVASEKTVRLASEEFKLPSRRGEYLVRKALEYEEARKSQRDRKLKEFLAKIKVEEDELTAKSEQPTKGGQRELFRGTQQRDSISHNTMNSTVFGRALVTGLKYGEVGDVSDLRNCRYIRHTSIDDTSRSHDDSYEARRRKRALDKVSSWGPLGVPHGGKSTQRKKRTSKHYATI